MNKTIDSCIDLLKKMLDDPNSELSSEQQSALMKGVKNLKRLKRSTRLSYTQVSCVVGQIAKAAYEILDNNVSE